MNFKGLWLQYGENLNCRRSEIYNYGNDRFPITLNHEAEEFYSIFDRCVNSVLFASLAKTFNRRGRDIIYFSGLFKNW